MDEMNTVSVMQKQECPSLPITRDHTIKMRTAILSISPEWMDILAALSIQPRTVSELQKQLNLAQPTVSNRLINMRNAGLVVYSEMSGTHLYRLVPEAIQATAEDIRETARRIEETALQIEGLIARKKKRRTA